MSESSITNRSAADMAGRRPRAIVYCDANLGKIDGKTANGLVRHSERYEIISVIDHTRPAVTPERSSTASRTAFRAAAI